MSTTPVPKPPAAGTRRPHPRGRLSPFQSLVDKAGWKSSFTWSEERARIEAFSEDGSAIMFTATGSRRPNAYVFSTSMKHPYWVATQPEAIEHFLKHGQLPDGAKRGAVTSKCACGKRGRFPTEAQALAVLAEKKVSAQQRVGDRPRVRRVYRCPHDDRVWHLTSRKKWYPEAPVKRGATS